MERIECKLMLSTFNLYSVLFLNSVRLKFRGGKFKRSGPRRVGGGG